MTREEPDRRREFPRNWDVLSDADPQDTPDSPPDSGALTPASPPTIALVSAFWADAVTVLAVVTAALLAINLAGHTLRLAVLPWALALGGAWWIGALFFLLWDNFSNMETLGLIFSLMVLIFEILPGIIIYRKWKRVYNG